jgi:WD40 repeat protein
MIAGLETGFLARAGAGWRVAEMRPGTAPFRNLADALAAIYGDPGVSTPSTLSTPSTSSTESVLRAGSLGLHKCLDAHPLPEGENLLIVADQFEELFRYADNDEARAEAAAFVSLLLAGSRPYPLPDGRISRRIYVVITMRSDFIGDCARFPGLAEAVNAGLYLTPRLTREQLREAVAEPPLVTGCDIEPALVARLLADVGDDPDQLPLLQHVLQWMWLRAREKAADNPLLTLADYETLGGFGQALSDRLDGIYKGLSPEARKIAETLFRNLSKRDLEQRDIRRPVRLKAAAELAGADTGAVRAVVEAFRRDGRNFIVASPNPDDPDDPLLDVCHESLLRQWKTLKDWLADEAESAAMYRRLEDAALRREVGEGGLWRGLDLANALAWKERFAPSAPWVRRYGRDAGAHFDAAMAFLEESRKVERSAKRRRNAFVGGFIVFLVAVAAVLMWQLDRTKRSEETARKAQEKTEKVEKQRTRDLFESQLTHASLQAKIEDYAAAKKILEKSRDIDADIQAPRRHARDLLDWYAGLIGGREEKVYTGAGVPLLDVAVSPDGKYLAAVGEKGTAVLFEMETGEIVRRLEGHRVCGDPQECSVTGLAFHPDDKWLATAALDGRILLWSTADGKVLRVIDVSQKIDAISVNSDGTIIAAGSRDSNITLWNTDTGEKVRTLKGHKKMVYGVAFSPDGTRLASASYDDTAMIWDVENGRMLHRLRGHAVTLEDVAFHPDGRIVATASSDRTVILWNAEDGRPINLLRGHDSIVHAVTFTESGDRLISGSRDNTIRVWDSETGVTLRVLQGHEKAIIGLAVKGHALFSASNDGTPRKWNLEPDARMRVVDVTGEPAASAISPDGAMIAVGYASGALRTYSLENLMELWSVEDAHSSVIQRIAFGPSGDKFATAGFDNEAKLWRIEDGGLEQTFKGHTSAVYGIDFSPDGRLIATAGYDGKIGLFEIGGEEGELFEGHEGHANSATFSSSEKELLTTGNDGKVRLWDISSRPPTVVMDFPRSMDQMMWAAISPDGTRVAAVGRDALVHIFDAADGMEIQRLAGHEQMIFKVVFSPDGGQVITISGDMRFWDLESAENLFTLSLPCNKGGASPPLWDFSFRCTPTGCWIVVPLTRGKVVVYRMENFYEK